MPRKRDVPPEASAGLPPELVKRIAEDVVETRRARRPLCPACGQRPQETEDGFCFTCSRERHERDKERKRRWWAKHADRRRLAQRSLDEISSDIRESYDVGREGYEQALDAYLAIGRDLLQARDLFPANQDYGRWFRAQHFPFKHTWARVLRDAAAREDEIRSLHTQVLNDGLRPNIKRALAIVRGSSPASTDDDTPSCRHCPIHCSCAKEAS